MKSICILFNLVIFRSVQTNHNEMVNKSSINELSCVLRKWHGIGIYPEFRFYPHLLIYISQTTEWYSILALGV